MGEPEKNSVGEGDDKPSLFDFEQPIGSTVVEMPEVMNVPEAKPKRGRKRKVQGDGAVMGPDNAADGSHEVPEAVQPKAIETEVIPKGTKPKKQVEGAETVEYGATTEPEQVQ
ncbi:MAG TPA: hypothetical protein V6D19_26140 [Stenomitos sp.]